MAQGLRVDWVIDQATAKHAYVIVDERGTRPVTRYSPDETLAKAISEWEGIEVRLVIDSLWGTGSGFEIHRIKIDELVTMST